jgi:hypothetical protein
MTVASAAPWITRMSRISLKSASTNGEHHRTSDHAEQKHDVQQGDHPGAQASPGARSPASASPAVWAVCIPAPVNRKASAAPPNAIHAPSPDLRQQQQRERHDGQAAELHQACRTR